MKRGFWLLGCVLLACGGHSSETVRELAAAGGMAEAAPGTAAFVAGAGSHSGGAGGALAGGSAPGGNAMGGNATGGNAAGSNATGGNAAGSNATGGNAAEAGAMMMSEAGAPDRCSGAVAGSFAQRDVAGDCHALVCDGKGGEKLVVDVDNVPAPKGDCWSATCKDDGTPASVAVVAGAACTSAGGKWCDGAGSCVACLADTDCAPGATCVQHACSSKTCSDGFIDGDETDIDCGGSCKACALTRDCKKDADCASGSCDALPPHRCLANHCLDNHKSADETDIDCGGTDCVVCGDGHGCKLDGDCDSGVCKLDRGPSCYSKSCLNGLHDNGETETDCGGGICDGCALGQTCYLNSDCANNVCDADTDTCITDHCVDHHWDADETDKDCGGASCKRCAAGVRCLVTSDCAPGLKCQPYNPHICL